MARSLTLIIGHRASGIGLAVNRQPSTDNRQLTTVNNHLTVIPELILCSTSVEIF
ncbi:hypothetical protein [Microcoleus sp. CAWBG58]|uniref:hypothetical protein n=1 Tax=Microcoleus sp. CAWBG58 TaxID=2841651 RepID=UPI0025DE14A8|nr:hypothetical protein [Microcoleus sp. CAWBG58]